MIDKITALVGKIISPEASNGAFVRKAIGFCMAVALGVFIWERYVSDRTVRVGYLETPLDIAFMRNDDLSKTVSDIIIELGSNRDIESVWLYDWEEATDIEPVKYFGKPSPPLVPTFLQPSNATAIGKLVLGECADTVMDRTPLYACPIKGRKDVWGILFVRYHENTQNTSYLNQLSELTADKISIVTYNP